MKALGLPVLVVLGFVIGGCAASAPRARRDAPPIYARCVHDGGEEFTRPLIQEEIIRFFFFCAESP